MFRVCKGSGLRPCKYDPTTHRCVRCDSWQRGFKPKAVNPNARDRGECQICEGKFSMLGGKLGHHGYKRPGCGYILGDCMGVGYASYPATDALVRYRKALEGRLEATEAEIARHKSPDLKGVTTSRRLGLGFSERDKTVVPFTILRGAEACYTPGRSHASFEDVLRRQIAVLENEANWYRGDIERVDARIAAAK